MVSRVEINAITVAAEERKRKEHIAYEEGIKENTLAYCSSTLSEALKKEADKPARVLRIYTTKPDSDGDVELLIKDGYYYKVSNGYRHLDTMVNFIRDHGFDVTVTDDTCLKNSTRSYDAKNISIRW